MRTCAAALAAVFLLMLSQPGGAQTWCGNSGLNATERAICNDSVLGELDLAMQRIYDRTGGRAADSQKIWLRDRRNACGSDIFCIERAYQDHIADLSRTSVPPRTSGTAPGPRPVPTLPPREVEVGGKQRAWCKSSRLNPTERTICRDSTLSDMDAALEAVYGRVKARDSDREQLAWLRGDRDSCGSRVDCIASAYLRRIVVLGGRLRRE